MRTVWDIQGGIHPPQQKEQSNQQPIISAGLPTELILPLSQHIGAPAKPIVKVGDQVLKGQKIADAKGFVSVPVHAPTSGKIIAIEHRPIAHPSGMSSACVVIKPNGLDQWLKHQATPNYRELDKSALLEIIRDAGIAGMGGAGFPAAVKLSTRDEHTIETLIINGTECEPYITADDMLMREYAKQVIEGTLILRHLINPSKKTLIGIEDNKPQAIAALQEAAKGSGIDIIVFATKYPSGGEKQLIQILTGKEVKSAGLPADIGIVCQNVGTTLAIYKAIKLGEPLISRITTVTGNACEKQQNFEVLLGTPIQHLLELCHFNQGDCSRLIMGGPMMGFTLESTQVPVVKTTNCVLAPTTKELPPAPPAQACIRCGMCEQACPASLLPQQLYWFARGKEYEKLETHHIMDCIECGACSYVCPSNIPLVQYYRASKADIRKQHQDHINAEHAKLRFESRQKRLEQQELEKEAKRKARKAAAQARAADTASDAKKDVIQAAIERANAKKVSADPAQNAIQKAMEKRQQQDQQNPQEKAEQAVASLTKRLLATQQKRDLAKIQNDDKLDIFETAVEKMQTKLEQAQKNLTEIKASPVSTNQAPVDDIVARALEKRAAAATMTHEQKLQNAVDSLSKRLEKAKEKLATAQEQNSDKASILADSVEKLTSKLADAKTALTEKA
ncbi:MAG: electron transport complex subunit RsxC [Spongiibacteraceae bacterium]|nr:electron transport complex subunit RsxC [Spongiibacteraceae bacterium]